VTDAEILAAAAAFVGGACHSATGFGFALVAAPLVAAALPPEQAVTSLLLLGILTSALTLLTEFRRPQPLWRDAAVMLAWGALGALAGGFILARLETAALQLLVTCSVIVALAARRVSPERPQRASRRHSVPAGLGSRGVAGLAAGVLTTTTTTNGPPLILYLLHRRVDAARMRDTLSVLFVGFGIVGVAALAVGAADLDVPGGGTLAALGAAAAVGHAAGRPLFARLAERHYERVVTALLVVSVVTGAIVALA